MSGLRSFWRERIQGRQRLPFSQQHEPLVGVKLAVLALARPYDLSTLHFASVRNADDGPHQCRELCYGTFAEARCDAGHDHVAPHETCACGFYAFRPDAPMAQHLQPSSRHWLLQVALSGKVVVHEHGYRGQHQRILNVTAPTGCVCQQGAPTLAVVRGRQVLALCVRCAAEAVATDGALAVAPSRLQELLGVSLQRRHLADCWVELLESGLIARQADPTVPLVADYQYTLRVRDRSSGAISEISSERSDVLGRWLMGLLGEGRLRQADLELVSCNRALR